MSLEDQRQMACPTTFFILRTVAVPTQGSLSSSSSEASLSCFTFAYPACWSVSIILRTARRRELIFNKSVELSKVNRESVLELVKMGAGARIHDYAVYAEMYYWLMNELSEKGRLPTDWRMKIKDKFPDIF